MITGRFWNIPGVAACICSVAGWLAVTNSAGGHGWRWLLAAFALFVVGAVLSKRAIAHEFGVGRILPALGAVLNVVGIGALLLPFILLLGFSGGKRGRR